jgi:hypothetical protein
MKTTNGNFSQELESWLSSKGSKTIQSLVDNFAEKSFAVLFLLLMAIPALPLPTGGVTHIFEIIVMLLALELIAGRRSVWLPRRWRERNLPKKLRTAALPSLIRLIERAEKFSRPRLHKLLNNSFSVRVIGLVILIMALFAFIAPPFSGLDTLPSFGAVLISLGMILDDIILCLAGFVAGLVGIGLVVALGSFVFQLI